MSLNKFGSPVAMPFTLQQALTHLKEASDGGDNDAYIEGELIPAALEHCERRIDRTLISTQWEISLDAFPDAIMLEMPPIISVQSVVYIDIDGNAATLDPVDYQVDTKSKPGWIVPAPGAEWPATQAGRLNAVTVIYTAGHGTTAASVPKPLVQWMKLALTELYENRSRSSEKPVLPSDFADGLLKTGFQVWAL
jgi:uncharacterized phiE125 gp8 family phage protein